MARCARLLLLCSLLGTQLAAVPPLLAATRPAGAAVRRATPAARALRAASSREARRSGPRPEAPSGRGRYPIVLLHGAFGFDRLGPIEYFNGVAGALAADGHQVFKTVVAPVQRSIVRARQLAPQIDEILRATGAPKVHLIGHSQGGLDARALISSLGYGDRVASLTTIGTPHRGVGVGAATPGPRGPAAPREAAGAHTRDQGSDFSGLTHEIGSQEGVARFNLENPDDPRVAYFSIAGRTHANPLAALASDMVRPALLGRHLMTSALEGPNDGIVSVASARWGHYLGEVPADHYDQMGLPSLLPRRFDHLSLYRRVARFVTDAEAPPPLGSPGDRPRLHSVLLSRHGVEEAAAAKRPRQAELGRRHLAAARLRRGS